jgi:hypothetical protein
MHGLTFSACRLLCFFDASDAKAVQEYLGKDHLSNWKGALTSEHTIPIRLNPNGFLDHKRTMSVDSTSLRTVLFPSGADVRVGTRQRHSLVSELAFAQHNSTTASPRKRVLHHNVECREVKSIFTSTLDPMQSQNPGLGCKAAGLVTGPQ